MRKLSMFNFVTLNGFYKDAENKISWHKHGEEEAEYSVEGLKSDSILLFGRKTYEMMVRYWTSPMAMEYQPAVAEGMNKSEKIVLSRTMKKAEWNNTTLIKENVIEKIQKLKQTSQKDLTILGSGSIVAQCAEAGLIDEYQIMIDPVAIGNGTPIFQGIKRNLDLKLISTRTFKSGVVLLCYQPAK